LISRLQRGDSIALVTDAGTPGVSDPGVELVQASIQAGVPVDPIPGVSAALTAAVASGFPLIPLTIFGFPPYRSKDRTAWLETLSKNPSTVTFFEAPHRIAETLRTAALVLGDRPIMVGRELTKVHQEFLRGSAGDLAARLESRARGELTVVIGPMPEIAAASVNQTDASVAELFGLITNNGAVSRRAAIAQTARRLGMSVRDVYAAVERHKIGQQA
jgi:16S rRNA (cytidine1402-2'-O)-methyltransferase